MSEHPLLPHIPPPTLVSPGTSIYQEDAITVLSYNILLPNSVDGWWVYKMYSYRHGIPAEQTSWEVRKALLQQEISIANCDVVCFQEVSADSFDSDFSFMGELGFDRSEIYKRGRFRPATFWKSARVETVAASLHRDRVLVIPFRRVRGEGEQTTQTVFVTSQQEQGCQGQESISLPPLLPEIQLPLYVANCHLQAGEHSAERRLRQVHDALESIRKEATKIIQLYLTSTNKIILSFKKARKKQLQRSKQKDDTDATKKAVADPVEAQQPELVLPWACQQSLDSILKELPVVVLGDMNCDPNDHSGAHALLVHGEATANGKVQVNSAQPSSLKVKKQLLGQFLDVYDFAYASHHEAPPPTMICEHLYGVITDPLPIPLAPALITTASTVLGEDRQEHEQQKQQQQQHTEQGEQEQGERHQLSAMAVASLRGMFQQCATQTLTSAGLKQQQEQEAEAEAVGGEMVMVMGTGDIQRWLQTINLSSTRGSERRAALARLKLDLSLSSSCNNSSSDGSDGSDDSGCLEEFPAEDKGYYLDWQGFRELYEEAVNEGKVWSVSWDMAVCGFPVHPDSMDVYSARYDRAYVSLGWLQQQQQRRQRRQRLCQAPHDPSGQQERVLVAVSELGVGNVAEGCRGVGGCLPNKGHPSDHLPISLALHL